LKGEKLYLVALGSPLRGDDGAALVLMQRLAAFRWPPWVRLVTCVAGDVGTLLQLPSGPVVVMDVLHDGGPPGRVVMLSIERLPLEVVTSLHQAPLAALRVLCRGRGLLVGCTVSDSALWGMTLSPPVRSALPCWGATVIQAVWLMGCPAALIT